MDLFIIGVAAFLEGLTILICTIVTAVYVTKVRNQPAR
jgi:hypothetical protein